jgi:DNA repair protein RecO (recombination protein O)
MPARETEAIILRSFPLGEADRLVSFLSRSAGKLRGVAAGARRLKNRFGSTLEILSYVKMWYVERETRELVRIRQCEMLESFLAAQQEYNLNLGLAMVSEVTEAVLPEREPSDAVFRLALTSARAMARERQTELPLAYFAFWMVKLGGWLPPLDRCSRCARPFGRGGAYHASFHPALLCEDCRRPAMRPASAEARDLGQRFSGEKLEQLSAQRYTRAAVVELGEAMLDLIEHHMEKELTTRAGVEGEWHRK